MSLNRLHELWQTGNTGLFERNKPELEAGSLSLGAQSCSATPALFKSATTTLNLVIETLCSRAETTRSLDELAFLADLTRQMADSSDAPEEQDRAARLQFTIANMIYERNGEQTPTVVLSYATRCYTDAKRLNAASVSDLWVQYKKDAAGARAATSPENVLQAWTRAKATANQLVAFDDENWVFVRAAWTASQRIADHLSKVGDVSAARSEATNAVAAVERLVDVKPDKASTWRDLWTSLVSRGDISRRAANFDGARQDYERALGLAESSDDATSDVQRHIAQSQTKLGEVAREAGHLTDAQMWFERSLVLQRALVDADPQNTLAVRDLAKSYGVQGAVLTALGGRDDAQALALSEAVKFRTIVVSLEPSSVVYNRELTVACEKLALSTKSVGDWERASNAAQAFARFPDLTENDQKLIKRIRHKAG